MIELIMKMVVCLLIALLLGFIIGWLLSKLSRMKKHHIELDEMGYSLDEKNKRIETLESQFVEKETALMKFNNENQELKVSLNEKTNLLNEHTHSLTTMQEKLSKNQNSQNQNESLIKKVTLLEEEIEGLETVLVKAEETIESKNQLCNDKEDELSALRVLSTQNGGSAISLSTPSDNQTVELLERKVEELTLVNKEKTHSIELYQNTIGELENELKLYTINGEEDEFVISKDQFTHIEEQLVDYQKEIETLKAEKNSLLQKNSADELASKEVSSDLDDIAIVKLFRETYKKITKS